MMTRAVVLSRSLSPTSLKEASLYFLTFGSILLPSTTIIYCSALGNFLELFMKYAAWHKWHTLMVPKIVTQYYHLNCIWHTYIIYIKVKTTFNSLFTQLLLFSCFAIAVDATFPNMSTEMFTVAPITSPPRSFKLSPRINFEIELGTFKRWIIKNTFSVQ